MIKLKYFDSIRMLLRSGKEGDEYVSKIEEIKVVHGKAVLNEIPDYQYHVRISELVEISENKYRQQQEIDEKEFYVNYENGMIYFNNIQEGEILTVQYRGRGIIQYPAERIYVHNDEYDMKLQSPHVLDNLQSYCDFLVLKTKEFSGFLDDKIKEILEYADDKKSEVKRYIDEKVAYVNDLIKDYDWFVFQKTEEVAELVDDMEKRTEQFMEDKKDEYEEKVHDKYHEYIDYVDDYVDIADDKIGEINQWILTCINHTERCEDATERSIEQTDKSVEATEDCISVSQDAEDIYNRCVDLYGEMEIEFDYIDKQLEKIKEDRLNTRLIMKSPVIVFDDIKETYPNPEIGWGVQVYESGNIYRWNGEEWQYAYNLQGSIINADENSDGLLSKELFQKLEDIQENAEKNFRGDDAKEVLPEDMQIKTVIFVLSGIVEEGNQGINIKVPFDGNILSVEGVCNESGMRNTVFDIEIADESGIEGNTWNSIFEEDRKLLFSSSRRTTEKSYKFYNTFVNKGDFLRVKAERIGDGIRDITIHINIKL